MSNKNTKLIVMLSVFVMAFMVGNLIKGTFSLIPSDVQDQHGDQIDPSYCENTGGCTANTDYGDYNNDNNNATGYCNGAVATDYMSCFINGGSWITTGTDGDTNYYNSKNNCEQSAGEGNCISLMDGTYIKAEDANKIAFRTEGYCELITGSNCSAFTLFGTTYYKAENCNCNDGDPCKIADEKDQGTSTEENPSGDTPSGENPSTTCTTNGGNNTTTCVSNANHNCSNGYSGCNKPDGNGCYSYTCNTITNTTCTTNGGNNQATCKTNAQKCSNGYSGCNTPDSNGCYSYTCNGNIENNPKTGMTAIMLAWIIGIMAVGYSIWYFVRLSKVK